jgi:hypothetical protein
MPGAIPGARSSLFPRLVRGIDECAMSIPRNSGTLLFIFE